MKVALVHDWLTGMRGGEAVLEALCELYPDADLYTLLHLPSTVSEKISNRKITTSFIQRLPMVKQHYRMYLPLFPWAIWSFDLSGYDLVLSSSHCVAKGVITLPNVLHISYIHTPMRYIWDRYNDYFGPGRASLGVRLAALATVRRLRRWDRGSNRGVDHFVANSKYVAARVKKYYGRDSTVIYPPVDCGRFSLSGSRTDAEPKASSDIQMTTETGGTVQSKSGYLVVSALVPYKRVDIAVEAFSFMGRKLTVIGSGPEEERLRRSAGPSVEFLGWKSNEEIAEHYQKAAALIFPGEEDFGIVPVEAMASGTPVLAFAKGGALETVQPPSPEGHGKSSPTGLFFNEQSPDSLIEAVEEFESKRALFDSEAIRAHALGFDKERFKQDMSDFIALKTEEFARESRGGSSA